MTRQPKCPKDKAHGLWGHTRALYGKTTTQHKATMLSEAVVCSMCDRVYLKTGDGWKVYALEKGRLIKYVTQEEL